MQRSTICIIDTGCSPHIDLVVGRNRIAKFIDIIEHKRFPYDDNGHGTFMAGTIASSGIASHHRIIGVAKCNDLVIIKAIDKDGKACKSDIVDAMRIVLDIHAKYNIKTVLMSFGTDKKNGYTDVLERGVKELYDAGITTVSASGNNGTNRLRSPATSPYTISVGAVDEECKICDFTSRGTINGISKPDFYASGVDVMGLASMGYTKMTGSSVAAPYVAGIVAIIKDMLPYVGEEDVRTILRRLATYKNGIYIIE